MNKNGEKLNTFLKKCGTILDICAKFCSTTGMLKFSFLEESETGGTFFLRLVQQAADPLEAMIRRPLPKAGYAWQHINTLKKFFFFKAVINNY